MSLFRVVISFMQDLAHYQQERGALAMTPGQALDDVFSALQIDRTRIYNFRSFVEIPSTLDAFHPDTQGMQAVGSHMSVKDIWERRNS